MRILIGDVDTVAEKILSVNEVLGRLSRITFQIGVSALAHQKISRPIELLGTAVVSAEQPASISCEDQRSPPGFVR
jgi:hypothetical protein